MEIRIEMMAMTMRSSIRVNPILLFAEGKKDFSIGVAFLLRKNVKPFFNRRIGSFIFEFTRIRVLASL